MEEKALLESEEKEKPKQDKLKKPPVKKCAPSPRDVRKQLPVNAVNKSKSTASPSPLTLHKPCLHVNFNSLPVVYPSIDPAVEVGWNFNPDSLF